MPGTKRIIIDKPIPGNQYKVGQSYIMPAIAADSFVKKGLGHKFSAEDWAAQQKREEEEAAARKEAKAKRRAEQKKHAAEVDAARPAVDAADVVQHIEARLRDAERRLEGATKKKKKEWASTVKAIRAELKAAQAKLNKLRGEAPAPDPEITVND